MFTDEQKLKRVKATYSALFPLNTKKEDMDTIKNSLKGKDFKKSTLIICPYDWMRPTFLFMFLSLGEYVSNKIFNAYKLLDIYLGNDEEFQSISQVSAEYIATYLGYGEFENRRQADSIVQLASYQDSRNKSTWLYYKGNVANFKAKYPDLYTYYSESTRVIITLGRSNKDSKGRSELI